MDNTWYYTLSTIAQTLAAILGLSVVFVTIRLQNITEKLKEYKRRADYINNKKNKHIVKNPSETIERSTSGLHNDLQEIVKNYHEKYEKDSGFGPDIASLARTFEPNLNLDNFKFIKDTTDNLYIYINQREKLLNFVKLPGIFTSSTIAYTIILLSMSNPLVYDKCLSKLLFYLATISSILSIVFIINASWKLLKESGQKI